MANFEDLRTSSSLREVVLIGPLISVALRSWIHLVWVKAESKTAPNNRNEYYLFITGSIDVKNRKSE